MAAATSATLGLAIQSPGSLLGGKPEAHLFVGVQHQRRDECLFQALSTSITRIVMCDYYVIQIGEVITPCPHIGTEGAEGQLYQLVPQVDLQPPQACSGVKLSK